MKFNHEALEKWENEKHIPLQIKKMVNAVMESLDMQPVFCLDDDALEEVIIMRNRGGYIYARGKGFSLSYCTSSYAEGPDADPSYLINFIKGLGFRIENSYGDNGMDSATNWHDTYWTYDFLYEPSETYEEEFEIWEDSDYED